MRLWKHNFRLIHSVYKDIVCIIYVLFLNIGIYVGTCLDYINQSNMYICLIGIILFSDLILIDKNCDTSEILHLILNRRRESMNFLQRYTIVLLECFVLFVISWLSFLIRINIADVSIAHEPVGFGTFIVTTFMSMLVLGTISLTISNVAKSKYVGYLFSLVYWVFWMSHTQIKSIFNLFPFVMDSIDYMKYIGCQVGLVLALLVLNIFFWNEKWITKSFVLRRVK